MHDAIFSLEKMTGGVEVVMTDAKNVQHILNAKVAIDLEKQQYFISLSKVPGAVVQSVEFKDAIVALFSKAREKGDFLLTEALESKGIGRQMEIPFGDLPDGSNEQHEEEYEEEYEEQEA
jgi:hypothetical protein